LYVYPNKEEGKKLSKRSSIQTRNGGREGFFIFTCIMGAFAILSSTMSKNPVLPLLASSLGARAEDMGLIAAASTIPGIIISFPAGLVSDIWGRRKVVVFSLCIFATAPFIYLFVTAPWQLVIVRFYHGFATAIFGPVVNAAIAERYPKRKGERISTFSSATLIGRGIAPFLGGSILYLANFISVYLAVGISAIIALFVGIFFVKDIPSEDNYRKRNERTALHEAFGLSKSVALNPRIILTGYVEAVTALTYGAFEFFVVLYAKSLSLDNFNITLISGTWLLIVMLTKPQMGRLSDKIGRTPLIIGGSLLGGIPLLLIIFVSDFPSLMVISMVYGLGYSAITSSTAAYVSDLSRKKTYGSALGFLSTIMDVGQSLGPILTGLIIAAFDYIIAFQTLGAFLLTAATLFYAVRVLEK